MLKHIRLINIFLVIVSVLLCSCASGGGSSVKASAPEADYAYSESSGRSADTQDDDRMMTYTVTMSLSVKKPEETRILLSEQVKSNKGFIVKETESYITTRIPAENMDNFMNEARALGKVENETKTGVDITDQYRDNAIRLESLKTLRARYLSLLDKANNVSDILSIEKELERVNTQIDILEGKQKYAEASVAYSNITVRFREKTKPGPVGWIFVGLYQGIKWLFVWN